MGRRNYYIVDENSGVFFVKLEELEGLPFHNPQGSYNVLKARLFNCWYHEFLKLARDKYHATLKGKKGFIVEFFQKEKDAQMFCKELNSRLNKVLDYYHL